MDEIIALLPVVLPLLTALVTLFVGKYLKQAVAILPLIGIGGAAALAFAALFNFTITAAEINEGTLFSLDFIIPSIIYNSPESLGIGLQYDFLSVFMACVASGLSFLIAIFSIEYMNKDEHLVRYWFFFQVFVTGMNLLVLGADLILLYVGWETVGLASFALIGHWFMKPGEEGEKPQLAGLKAFVFTHIGDFGLLLAIALIFSETGLLNLQALGAANWGSLDPNLILALVFFAACGKSAQFPLLTWLSSPDSVDIDAMQGPTTVSALIHAATMVKAGIYLMARFFPITRQFDVSAFATFMAIIVSITVLISALSALTSKDLKRVLAYSTISQLSYMFLGLCVAYFAYSESHELGNLAFVASQFHLMTHAIFKALLFLAAAAIIHGIHQRSMLDMGGIRTKMPVVFYTMLAGAGALVGFPLLSGFFSKDAVIGVAFELFMEGGDFAIWGLMLFLFGLSVAFITALYTTRMIMLIFSGTPQSEGAEHAHAPGIIMRGVLVILAIPALGIWLFMQQFSDAFGHFLGSEEHILTFSHMVEGNGLTSMVISVVTVLLGIGVAYLIYKDGVRQWTIPNVPGAGLIKGFQTLCAENFYIDQLITAVMARAMDGLATFKRIHTGDLNMNMVGAGMVMAFLMLMVFIL